MNPGFERVGTSFLFTHTARALARTYYLLEFVAFIRRFVGQFLAFLLGRTLSTITRAFTPDISGIMIKVAA